MEEPERERLDPTLIDQGSLVPKWATVEHDDPNARYCILSYCGSDNKCYVDLFLFDNSKTVSENVDKIRNVVGGRAFRYVIFLYWLGPQ